ncbi:MAG: hypothetical protein ACI8QZ_000156 [Chlamydiales bacterium]|jgi:hypothetical protein
MRFSGILLFHLNLCYSSISKERRAEVVARCYWPLLGLLDQVPGLKLAIEASGHTLELIDGLDPDWCKRLRAEVQRGRVEFVGSGDTQLIGPLVPARVNRWNQRLGQKTYQRLLGASSTTALVNEMAWSQGMVDHYLDAGYETVVMEWNNPRLGHPEWNEEWRYQSVRTSSPGGRQIGVLWADTTAFQKMQRVAFGEIELEEYADWVAAQSADDRALFLYAGDAEIFDFRPGRYDTEPARASESEWARIAQAMLLANERGVAFTTPNEVWSRSPWDAKPQVRLTSCADPAPVKKQPKYNLTRWALSGRDDLHLNAFCFGRAADLELRDGKAADWRHLCRTWGSDLRTHLSADRWQDLQDELAAGAGTEPEPGAPVVPKRCTQAPQIRQDGRRLELSVGEVQVTLNLRRGLAIERVLFRSLGHEPVFGTLPHGTFDSIHWTADFYSGHTVLELPGTRRVTDLEPVEHHCWIDGDAIVVEASVPTALGPLPKRIRITGDGIEQSYGFSAWGPQPRGSLRTAHMTLFPEFNQRGLAIRCAQGGLPETFPIDRDCDHGHGLSPFVSARAAFGASEGPLQIVAGDLRLDLEWRRDRCPVLPLLSRTNIDGQLLTRLAFSLEEVDDTSLGGGSDPRRAFPDFDLRLTAHRVLHPVYQ